MGYLINDALDELVDLVVAIFWPNGVDTDEEQTSSGVRTGLQTLRLELSDEQRKALELRVQMRRLSQSRTKVNLKRPEIKLSNLVHLDNLRSDGLLGRLVAQYWAGARARAWYQVRCGALSWDDDTPTWKQREKQLISDAERRTKLADPKWFGVALSNANFLNRWDGGSSGSKKWRRRYSLEATFSNWSAPPWFEWAFTNDRYFGDPHNTVDESVGRWGGEVEGSGSEIYATGQKKAPVQWKAFLEGEAGFGEMMVHLGDAYVFHGYKEYITNWQDRGTYANVGTGPRAHFASIPWRTAGKHVSAADRRSANYRFKAVSGNRERTKKQIERYYMNGYYLVRTALDVLLARKVNPQDVDGFEAHCEWWGIACPEPRFVQAYPDLSAIGGGIVGLADVSSAELVDYVMAITPRPGTIPPWEDNGPLWTWPKTTGHMFCSSVPIQLKPRESSNVWGTIAQYILGVEQSLCANVAKGVLDEALDVIVAMAKDLAAEWLSQGVDRVLAELQKQLGSAGWDAAKELLGDVSSAYANISRFADADKLVGELSEAAQLPKALTEYLDGVADKVSADELAKLARHATSQIDVLREEWEWADDLIGSAASLGDRVNGVLRGLD